MVDPMSTADALSSLQERVAFPSTDGAATIEGCVVTAVVVDALTGGPCPPILVSVRDSAGDVDHLMIGFDTYDRELHRLYRARLQWWRDQATPVTLCAARGRHPSIWEHDNRWLPLPAGGPASSTT